MITPTLADANLMADLALAEGVRLQLAPLCVVVLDVGGHLLVLKRDHRASIHRPEIAIAKASGCLGMGFGGRELARRAETMPGFVAALGAIFAKGLLAVPGGVLIRDAEGLIVGAVGISGDTSDNDERCAVFGIAGAGFSADTGD